MNEPVILDPQNAVCQRAQLVASLAFVRKSLTGTSLRRVRTKLARAWVKLLALDVEEALAELWDIEPALSDFEAPVADPLRAGMSLLRAVGFAVRDDCVAALSTALSCLGNAALTSEPRLSAIARTVCRLAYWKLGDFTRFHSVAADQAQVRKHRDVSLLAFDGAMEAAVQLQQLRFGAASRLAQDVLLLLPRRACAHVAFGRLLARAVVFQLQYEQGALADAEEWARELLPLIPSHGSLQTALRVYPTLAKIARQRMQGDLAMLTLAEGEALGERRGWSRLVAVCLQERVELLARSGRLNEAEGCLQRLHMLLAGGGRSHYANVAIRRHYLLARAGLALIRAPTYEIVATLKHLQREATASGDLYLAVQLTLRLAEALAALNETSDATETLLRSLELGGSVGMYQSFLDCSPMLEGLLSCIVERLASSEPQDGDRARRSLLPYVKSVLRGWRKANRAGPGEERETLPLSGPLSSREHAILQLISRGHSNKRVAEELRITPETVKTYVKRMFVKLGAQNRLEAVSRAAELGLI